jgi:hypothetical protein
MEIKLDPKAPGKNFLMAGDKVKLDWLTLFQDFPDRFTIGSDQHYPEPSGLHAGNRLCFFSISFQQIRRSIGTENVAHIYDARPNKP